MSVRLATLSFATLGLVLTELAWCQPVHEYNKFVASDAAGGGRLGSSVGISGDLAVVGAPQDNDVGSCYIIDVSSGRILFQLTSSSLASGDSYGGSVSIDNTTVVAAAPFEDLTDGSAGAGAVYVYDSETGQLLHKLRGDDTASLDRFGDSVSIYESTIVVGARGDNQNTGSAYLFDSVSGQQLFKLTASDGSFGAAFGTAVDLDGDHAIVGASLESNARGSAYIFDTSSETQLLKLTANDGASSDFFGVSVAIDGPIAIVGAPRSTSDGPGAAYLFDVSTGQQLFKLLAPEVGVSFNRFGTSVAIENGIALVGSPRFGNTGSEGSAFLFCTNTGALLGQVSSPSLANGDFLGTSVAVSGNTILTGSPLDNGEAGSASAYRLIDIAQQPRSLITTAGNLATFSLELLDDSNATYQWRYNSVPLTDGGGVSGSNTPMLEILASESDEGNYDCVVSNPLATIVSETVVLGIRPDPDECFVDLNGDGILNFFDVSDYILSFNNGCP